VGLFLQRSLTVVPNEIVSLATIAIMTMAEVKAAVESFERGDINVFDALVAVGTAWEAYEDDMSVRRQAA
jgi:hypothetical protein